MSRDSFMKFFKEVRQEAIKKMIQDGLTEEEMNNKLNDENMQKTFSDLSDERAINNVEYMDSTMYEVVMERRAISNEFISRNEQIWLNGFVASEAMYIYAMEVSSDYKKYLDSLKESVFENKEFLLLSLRHIHARACQIYFEIIYLMRSGFADGAYARWRSMYELSVIGAFIVSNGEEVAKAFSEASETEIRYDWAKKASCFAKYKKHITFNDIQEKCDFVTELWKQQYTLANKLVHASPQGTFKRLGIYESDGTIPGGHTDYGFSVAAEHAAISLSIITSQYLNVVPYGDGIVFEKTMIEWIDIIRKHYDKAEAENFDKENESRTTRIDGTKINKE